MIKQIWIRLCNEPKPFYSFDFASFEAFILVQYPPDHTIMSDIVIYDVVYFPQIHIHLFNLILFLI
jgi:hypothetical protein